MNKQDLKSLLENIYYTLTEEGEWHPPLLAPEENPNWSPFPPPPPSTKPTQPYTLPDPWWQPPPPPPTPPKPVYPPWPTDPEDERSRLRGLMIDDYDGWLEDMERDPTWWSDRYGFDVLEWWRRQNPGPEYRPGGMSG